MNRNPPRTRYSRQYLRVLLALWFGCLVQGCATPEQQFQDPPDWPAGVPAASPFRAAWRADAANRSLQSEADYLQWVQRFYLGGNLVPGWLDLSEQVLQDLNEAEQASVSGRLWQLGMRIGREWAKDNAVRRVNTRMVAVWRDALLEALRREDLEAYLLLLEHDVAALLAAELGAEEILFERYYINEFDS